MGSKKQSCGGDEIDLRTAAWSGRIARVAEGRAASAAQQKGVIKSDQVKGKYQP